MHSNDIQLVIGDMCMTLSLTAMISIDPSKTGLVYDQKVMANSLGIYLFISIFLL